MLCLLLENGFGRTEIERLDTRIKQISYWIIRNEPELTKVRRLENEENDNAENEI